MKDVDKAAENFARAEELASKTLVSACLAVLRLNWVASGFAFIAFMGLIVVKEIIEKNNIGGGIAEAIIWSMFVGPTMRSLVSGEIGFSNLDHKLGTWLRFWVLGVLAYIPATAISIYLQESGVLPMMSPLGAGLLIVMAGFFGSFVAAFLGTCLVPPVIGKVGSIGEAMRRGFRTWRFSLLRLLGTAFVLQIFLAGFLLVGGLKLQWGDIISKEHYINVPELLFFSLVTAGHIFITAISAVIVARAYMLAEKLKPESASG